VWVARDLLEWVITVEDNGPGVDEEHRELIFQMFKRSRTDVEGSGIGLALCKKIVGIHRGKIWVDSGGGPPERPGAVFRVSLLARAKDEITQH
jgi:signal transduction histidine kinase